MRIFHSPVTILIIDIASTWPSNYIKQKRYVRKPKRRIQNEHWSNCAQRNNNKPPVRALHCRQKQNPGSIRLHITPGKHRKRNHVSYSTDLAESSWENRREGVKRNGAAWRELLTCFQRRIAIFDPWMILQLVAWKTTTVYLGWEHTFTSRLSGTAAPLSWRLALPTLALCRSAAPPERQKADIIAALTRSAAVPWWSGPTRWGTGSDRGAARGHEAWLLSPAHSGQRRIEKKTS